MEQSTLHIKAPHELHLAAKVKAARLGISMNQYVVDLIGQDIGTKEVAHADAGIKVYREVISKFVETPAQKANREVQEELRRRMG